MGFHSTFKCLAIFTIIAGTSARRSYSMFADFDEPENTTHALRKEAEDMAKSDPKQFKGILDEIHGLIASKFVQRDIKIFSRTIKAMAKAQSRLPVEATNLFNHEFGQFLFIVSEAANLEYHTRHEHFPTLIQPSLSATIQSSMAKYNERFVVHTRDAKDAAANTLTILCAIPKLIEDLEKAKDEAEQVYVYFVFTRETNPHGFGQVMIAKQLKAAEELPHFKKMLRDVVRNVEQEGAGRYALVNAKDVQANIKRVADLAITLKELAALPATRSATRSATRC